MAGTRNGVAGSRWRRAFAVAALAVTPVVGACGSDGEASEPTPLAEVELTDAGGGTVSTADWTGEPLVINFWYSTCAPCAKELAEFADVDAERDDVRFIGINPLDDVADMTDFATDRGVTYDLYRDELAELQTALGIASFPTTVFVDASGDVVGSAGVLDAPRLRSRVDDLVAESAPATPEDAPATGTSDDGGDMAAGAGWNGIVRDPAPRVDLVELPVVTDPTTTLDFAADEGRVRVVYFGFTACPDVCPTTMSDLAVALRMLGDEAERVDVAMVSVDPDRDEGALDDYVNAFVPGSTGLLTDDVELLQSAGEPFGADWEVRTLDDGTVEVDHTPFLYAVDDEGLLAVTWQFGTSSDLIAADLTRLLDDSGGTV